MLGEIAVHGHAIFGEVEMHPIGLAGLWAFALLEHDDVGGHFNARIGFECVVGEAYGAHELRSFC